MPDGPPGVHHWTIDSIEEGVAAIEEDGARLIHVPVWLLPDDARAGDVLRARRDGDRVLVERDDAARDEALRRSREQTRARPNPRDPGGPIDL